MHNDEELWKYMKQKLIKVITIIGITPFLAMGIFLIFDILYPTIITIELNNAGVNILAIK